MQTELYDSKTDNIMCNADITFGPGTFIVNSCTGYDKYKDITPAQLEDFLSSRIHYEHTYAFDDIVLAPRGKPTTEQTFTSLPLSLSEARAT